MDSYSNFPNGITSMGVPLPQGIIPPIWGTYQHVNPKVGAAGNTGQTGRKFDAISSFANAITKCGNGTGDGVILWSAGTTSAHTTSYLSAEIDITQSDVTICGVSSGTRIAGRSRISNLSTAVDLAYLLDVQGSNNLIKNVHVANYGSDAAALGSVIVSGNRNTFVNCHFAGGGHATPAAETGMYSLKVTGSENTFVDCTFGLDTITRGAANGEVLFDGGASRNRFYGCEIMSYSATAGHGAVNMADATCVDRWTIFERCKFVNWNENGLTDLTKAFIGTEPTSGYFLLVDCFSAGYTAWDATTNKVFTCTSGASNAAGGVATAAH